MNTDHLIHFSYARNIRDQRTQEATAPIFDNLTASNVVYRLWQTTGELSHRIDELEARVAAAEAALQNGGDAQADGAFGEVALEDLRKQLKDARKQYSEAKAQLPVFCFHATFEGGRRVNAAARESGLCMIDLDHIEGDPLEYYRQHIQGREDEAGVAYAHLTPSRHGLHLVCLKRYADIQLSQQYVVNLLGIAQYFDACVHDLARPSYVCAKEATLYLNKERLFGEKDPYQTELVPDPPQALDPPQAPDPPQALPVREGVECSAGHAQGGPSSSIAPEAESSTARPADAQSNDTTLPLKGERGGGLGSDGGSIFSAVFAASHLPESHLTTDGHLHTTLLMLLSQGLAKMLTRPQLEEVLREKMPTYAGCDDCNKLLDSAYNDYKMQNRTMTQQQMGIYARAVLKEESAHEAPDEQLQLPPLPSKLPPLMQLYAGADLEECFQPAVCMHAFAALATHLSDVRFADNGSLLVEPTQLCMLMAPPQAGKSCINAPLLATNADIQARDNAYRAQMDAWNEQVRQLSGNDRCPPEPKYPLQIVMSNITSAALIKRLTNARPRPLYTKLDEIELLRGISGTGTYGASTQLLRLAYDTADYGAERATASGVSGKVPLRWNLSISTTLQNGRQFLGRQAAADGTISRFSMATIQRSVSTRRPRFGHYGEDFRQQLQPYLQRLNDAQGTYLCPEAVQFMDDLNAEIVDHILLSDDLVATAMCERGVTNAFKRAMVLYIAEGAWSPEIADFARWSFYYDLACKRLVFGDFIEDAMKGEELAQNKRRGPQNLLIQMGLVFSREELSQKRLQNHMSANPQTMLHNWVCRGYISERPDGRYDNLLKAKNRGLAVQ